MADAPMYTPFFGIMGATSAMVFSGKCIHFNYKEDFAGACLRLWTCTLHDERCKKRGLGKFQ